ncbi:polyisoprenoid-binding protein [Corynebacterium sp. zg-331]|uniref:YceI family protein n=1 Tax=unclassified Corynebacterium TaxID=2624378 RepID=UPI00128E383E|nr:MULTISPECIES: YceI family protein [unclassified Corynebacterium]MBC3186182.1 polyisoprenoid-binding protein [Corynebacterium sp. zg-331]MPV52670.1 polyisoprenoid-binding protein [Corynebacterium sp. zg331]
MSPLTGTYSLDVTHSTVGFVVRHAMVSKVRGFFRSFESTLTIDAAEPSRSTVTATIEVASLDTGNADRDAHVKGGDFFDTEAFPEMTFNATAFDMVDEHSGTVTGDLTIKGTTKPVTLSVEVIGQAEDPMGATRLGFSATTTLNRKDYGIDFQMPLKAGGLMLSEEIAIEIEGSAVKSS